MVFGIVVEGIRDVAAYSEFIPRIRPLIRRVIARPCGGKSPVKHKFVGYLEEFEALSVEKALVIRDSDCRDPREIESMLEQRLHESNYQPPFPVHFYATHCMLETWLLADEAAVNQVARDRSKRARAQRIEDPLEGRRNSRQLFNRMLSQARLPADPVVYAQVASLADVDLIQRRCPYFRQFATFVHGC